MAAIVPHTARVNPTHARHWLLEPGLTVKSQYLDASFSEVKAKYKTFDKYLAAVGVTKADKQKLQDELLAG